MKAIWKAFGQWVAVEMDRHLYFLVSLLIYYIWKDDCLEWSVLRVETSLLFLQNPPYRLRQLSHFEWFLNKTITTSFQYLCGFTINAETT